jgi:hypothetical protein
LVARDKASLDVFWLKDDSLELFRLIAGDRAETCSGRDR